MLRRIALATSLVFASAGCTAVAPTRLVVKSDPIASAGALGTTASTPTVSTETNALRPNALPGVAPEAQLTAPAPATGGGSSSSSSAPAAPIDRYQRLREVADMFSLKNPRVGQVTGGVMQVAGVAIASGLVSNAGGGLISNNGGGIISDQGGSYRVMGLSSARQGLYKVLSEPETELVVDPENEELVGVTSPEVDLAFDFDNQGRTRTWQATVDRAADHSTGSLEIEVTSDWQPVEQTTDPGYKLFQDQVPTNVERVAASIDFTPAGDTASRLQAGAQVTGFVSSAGQTLPALPTQASLQAAIADLTVSVNTQYAAQAGKAVLTARSVLTGNVFTGPETLTVDFKRDENTLKQDITVTSALAHVKFTFTTDVALPDAAPSESPTQLTAPLLSSDDNTVLGSVTWNSEHPTRVTLTLVDGRQLDWDLLGGAIVPADPEAAPIVAEAPASAWRLR